MIQWIRNWWENNSGVTHAIAGFFLFLVAAYFVVDPFQALVLAVYHAAPRWAQTLVGVVIALIAFYHNGYKPGISKQ
jgi:hypothetical protein